MDSQSRKQDRAAGAKEKQRVKKLQRAYHKDFKKR
jgi:hypothetical protein